MTRFLIPLGIFTVIAVFLLIGLERAGEPGADDIPSPLVGKPAPNFTLAQLHAPEQSFAREDVLGQVWLLNVWASWCVSCRQEHPLFVRLARTGVVPIYGLNYKDARDDAVGWLQDLGDPYVLSAMDPDGRVGIDYGVYGVPETYVIDRQGVIRYKHVGPVTEQALQQEILPLVRKLQS